ncbi:MAG: DUF4339 domain-containing protein [Verrucomicrobiota bacterium]|nr:DUF4339 domain-containing protein [Verrucomicrobiota bacterium]
MQFYITRQGGQSGPFSEAEFNRMTKEGKITPTDYIWHEPLTEWILFKDFDALRVKPAEKEYTKYYKVDSRKLSFGECWSFSRGKFHLFLFVSLLKILRIPFKLSEGLPEAREYKDLQIREDELPIEALLSFRDHTIPAAQKGFDLVSYATLANNLMPSSTYVADYLHQDHTTILRLFFSHTETLTVTVLTLVTYLDNGTTVTTTTRDNGFKTPPHKIKYIIKTDDLDKILHPHLSKVKKHSSGVNVSLTTSTEEFGQRAFQTEKEFCEYNIARGVLVEMTPDEIAAVKMSRSKLRAT